MAIIKNTYKRSVEIESRDVTLLIHQCEVGDVGCVVWDAGLVLAKYIDTLNGRTSSGDQPAYFAGKKIIDIGSGTGVVGLAAASVGGHVLLTDLPEILPLLKLNVEENHGILTGSAEARVLRWGGEDSRLFPVPDILLVGDCVYYEDSVRPLVETLSHLSGPHTEVLLSYEERHEDDKIQIHNLFMELMKERFGMERVPETELDQTFQSPDIHILRLRKKEPLDGASS